MGAAGALVTIILTSSTFIVPLAHSLSNSFLKHNTMLAALFLFSGDSPFAEPIIETDDLDPPSLQSSIRSIEATRQLVLNLVKDGFAQTKGWVEVARAQDVLGQIVGRDARVVVENAKPTNDDTHVGKSHATLSAAQMTEAQYIIGLANKLNRNTKSLERYFGEQYNAYFEIMQKNYKPLKSTYFRYKSQLETSTDEQYIKILTQKLQEATEPYDKAIKEFESELNTFGKDIFKQITAYLSDLALLQLELSTKITKCYLEVQEKK